MEKKITKCKCGMPIFFKDGMPYYAKKVPVLLVEKINHTHLGSNAAGLSPETTHKTSAYVSHFINCPNANDFSKGKQS